ncbi:MAG: hypothetical protein K940chlam6_00168 [Chlamydiae bacterium]|nr:hypothetical protein [Chlamydiota bacterium]
MSAHTKTRRIRIRKQKVVNQKKEKSIPWREAFKKSINKHTEGGAVLKGFRSKDGVTQAEVAHVLNISQHHISEMENGKRPIGKEMAKKFAKYFNTDYRVFL